jgi:predicted AlkP superfamily phosphohydrolase/phosphomutase
MRPPHSDPPGAMEEILARYGPHPIPHDPVARTRCDDHDGSERGFRQLLGQLLTGAETRGRLLRDLLDSEAWDLFVGVFCEGHCAGHELWHMHDERSPWYDPAAPEDLRGALRRVYEQLDAALAHVLGGVGPDAHPNLPDLIIRWNQELNVIETLRSPRVGTVSRPVQSWAMPRSGDHSTESRLWAVGLEPPARAEVPGMRGVDFGPTILSLLGVELPPDLDGRPIELAARARSPLIP